ncbi:YybH family protein [Alteromonas facilis]|uniref:YybH family protein n=1 Tax=Alteromonas facilis TaxID=2048004 RepID=UPI0013DD7977|nr:nuclear transport factor 2 family protein [Alteromonas facilis]
MKKLFCASLFILLSLETVSVNAQDWNKEQLDILELSRWVALAPREAGYNEYAALFHPDFTNWYMAGDKESLRTREQYLSLVKNWLEQGNYATYSKVVPISVDVFGDIAYVRLIKEERFHHPDTPPTQFIGQFASLMKKHNGKWTFYNTSFDTRYRGPLEGSNMSLDDH